MQGVKLKGLKEATSLNLGTVEKNKWLNAFLERLQIWLHCTEHCFQQRGTLPGRDRGVHLSGSESCLCLPWCERHTPSAGCAIGTISFAFRRHLSWISARMQRYDIDKPTISRVLFPSLTLIEVLTCRIPQYCFPMTFAVNQRLQGKLDCFSCSAAAVGSSRLR